MSKRFHPKTPTFVSNAYTVHEPDAFLLVNNGSSTYTITLRSNPEDGEEFYCYRWANSGGGIAIQPATGSIYVGTTPTNPVGVGGDGFVHLIYSAELASWLQLDS